MTSGSSKSGKKKKKTQQQRDGMSTGIRLGWISLNASATLSPNPDFISSVFEGIQQNEWNFCILAEYSCA